MILSEKNILAKIVQWMEKDIEHKEEESES